MSFSPTNPPSLSNVGNILYLSNNITKVSSNLTIGTSPNADEQFYFLGNANVTGNLAVQGNLLVRSNANVIGNLSVGSNLSTFSNVTSYGIQNITANVKINQLLTSYNVPTDYATFINASFINQSNATPVSSWNGFTQSNVSIQPTYYTTGGYNNGPYVKFNGTNNYMEGPIGNYPWTSSGGETTFMLVRFDGAYTNSTFYGYTVNPGNTNAGTMYFQDNNALGGEWKTNLYNSSGTLVFAPRNHGGLGTGTYYLLTQRWGTTGSNNHNTYINGANIRSNTITGAYTDINGATPYIGGFPGYNSYKNISITSILHYNRLLTPTELTNVTNYMMNYINTPLDLT